MEQQAVKLFDWVDFMRNGYSSKLTDDSARPQVYALCANNYPFALSGRTDFKEAFDFNGRVRKISGNRRAEFGLPAGEGVSLVEMSDDCFAIPHLRAAKEHISQGRILEELNYSARENGVRICAVGTGAELSYAHVKEEGQAVFDRPPKARKYWLDKIFDAWGEWALALGVQVYTGKRPAVFANEKVFTDQVKLKNLSNYIKEVGGIDVSVPSFHPQEDLTNPDLEINGAEALNLGLSLYLNQKTAPRGLTQLTEQMQYSGMEPCTVDQLRRANVILSRMMRFGDMLDHGHVGVRGTRTSTDPRDYDVREFVHACLGPLVFAHHNGIGYNGKKAATPKVLDIDQQIRQGILPPMIAGKPETFMPFPERVSDINDAMLELASRPEIKVVVLSPEPKCDASTNLEELAGEVAEAQLITASKILGRGFVESEVMPMVFVTKGYKKQFDNFLSN